MLLAISQNETYYLVPYVSSTSEECVNVKLVLESCLFLMKHLSIVQSMPLVVKVSSNYVDIDDSVDFCSSCQYRHYCPCDVCQGMIGVLLVPVPLEILTVCCLHQYTPANIFVRSESTLNCRTTYGGYTVQERWVS